MASAHSPQLRSLYRRLLRELPTKASPSNTILSHPSPIQQRIRSTFAARSAAAPDAETAAVPEIQAVDQFIQTLKAQRMYATLVERYNPGMNMNEEERVRLTARKVGMNLPIEFVDDKR
ncbi:hypothetical protein EJ05DRAFT_479145 [Pseudovirgaria hyperparasitica]|uniref:Uncharacterized protein n=1 Tax=Pseudovirgaria hyperparasitica TaxID=470096 RepID=A0A6A6VX10_9PEZI|nr:uncharacterized protein EJ05DRAFT_479145 [Pseudovirgaria hyperparasitica]KAF2754715.1 hypothetical protein EJ05DRAFT_479145 [Pseudovirgaria hyperparasitica]